MKRIYLIRHAKSSWDSLAESDFERPLNDRGKSDAPRMAKYLRESGAEPDHFIASAATRTQATAAMIAGGIGFDPNLIYTDRRLYLADVNQMQSVMREFSDSWNRVFLVGHNPTITECANALANDDLDNIPTCGVYAIELNIDSWRKLRNGVGQKLFFVVPKLLPQLNT